MKTRETKQNDLNALAESLQSSTSAMVLSFTKLTVTKDQEFRNSLREAGANYQVVKNTLARIAVKGTQFEDATEHFKGVTAIAWTKNDPVILSKAISKFMKANADIYTFKTGVVDGKLVDLTQLTTIANLPSKEELISKLMWVLNSGAQRLVTVINAVPRDLAVVIKQIGEAKPGEAMAEPAAEVKAEEPAAAPAVQEAAPAEAEVAAEAPATEEAPAMEAAAEEAVESESYVPEVETEAQEEAAAAAPDDMAEEIVGEPAAEPPGLETEAASEQAVAAPDDKAEEILETAPEEAGDKAE